MLTCSKLVRCFLIVATVVAFSVTPSLANDEAEAVVRQVYDAMMNQDWQTATDLTHPEAHAELKALFWPMITEMVAVDKTGEAAPFIALFGCAVEKGQLLEKTDAQFYRDMIASLMTNPMLQLGIINAEVVGSIPEGDTLVHVLARVEVRAGEMLMKNLEPTSLKPYEGDWRAVLDAEMRGLVEQFRPLVEQLKSKNTAAGQSAE